MNLYLRWFHLALLGLTSSHASNFTSIHAFGDAVSSTTASQIEPSIQQYFYGERYCNGRIWIEALAEWQGLPYITSQNNSDFGHDIEDVESELSSYSVPADVDTALYILWVSGADFANRMFTDGPPYDSSNLTAWTNFIDDTLDSHEAVVSLLHQKGVRNLLIPNQPDLSAAPVFFLTNQERLFLKDRIQEFNNELRTRLTSLPTTLPGLRIWTPDVYTQFEDILANPSKYNLLNPIVPGPPDTFDYGLIPAFHAGGTPDLAIGPGTNYVFWDDLNPTAAVQFILANLVQNEISPLQINSITPVTNGYDLSLSNLPVGRPGTLLGSPDLQSWFEDTALTPMAPDETLTINTSDPARFFQLSFPTTWTWP